MAMNAVCLMETTFTKEQTIKHIDSFNLYNSRDEEQKPNKVNKVDRQHTLIECGIGKVETAKIARISYGILGRKSVA